MEKSVTSVIIQSTMTNFFQTQKYHDKFIFVLKLIWLLTVFNLFRLRIVQKCQCYQLCVLRKNLSETLIKLALLQRTIIFRLRSIGLEMNTGLKPVGNCAG